MAGFKASSKPERGQELQHLTHAAGRAPSFCCPLNLTGVGVIASCRGKMLISCCLWHPTSYQKKNTIWHATSGGLPTFAVKYEGKRRSRKEEEQSRQKD